MPLGATRGEADRGAKTQKKSTAGSEAEEPCFWTSTLGFC